LYEIVRDVLHSDLDSDLLMVLDQLYIDARYPGNFGLLPDGIPSVSEANQFFELAKKVHKTCLGICK